MNKNIFKHFRMTGRMCDNYIFNWDSSTVDDYLIFNSYSQ